MADAEELACRISEALNALAGALSPAPGKLSEGELRELKERIREVALALKGFRGYASPEFDLARAEIILPRLLLLLDAAHPDDSLPEETKTSMQESFECLGGRAFDPCE
jgi:hypothetical protein